MDNHNQPPYGYYQYNQFQPPPKPPENPMDLWKVVGMNFGIFVAYQALLVILAGEAFLIADTLPLIVHWVFMLVMMIVQFSRGKRMQGFGYLISLVVIIIIGFGSCFWIGNALGFRI
jgi:hypothetical protein